MPDPLTLSATCNFDALETRPRINCAGRLLCEVESGSPTAAAVIQFIGRRFEQAYGARPTLRIPRLLAMTTAQGTLLAAVGIRSAADETLFLEDYLDAPAESFLPGMPFGNRSRLAEVAHLAGVEAGVSRYLFASLTLWLRTRDFQWVTFTATQPLCKRLRRLGINLHEIAPADPERLADSGQGWGAYYEHVPTVVAANVDESYLTLERAGLMQRTGWLAGSGDEGRVHVHSA